ncbi:hypothetical protein NC652_001102 [Populus alba x Populus x berolinensis]|nr:hypothetical protein NC652_001102 [Populus alba x Populus x berolinensis]
MPLTLYIHGQLLSMETLIAGPTFYRLEIKTVEEKGGIFLGMVRTLRRTFHRISCHSCDGQSALLSATKAATEPTKAAQPLMGELRLRGWMRPYGAFELDICSQTPPYMTSSWGCSQRPKERLMPRLQPQFLANLKLSCRVFEECPYLQDVPSIDDQHFHPQPTIVSEK